MSWLQLLAASAIMGVGAIVQGVVGFGAALVAAPALMLVEPELIPGPIAVAAIALNLLTLRLRGNPAEADPAIRWAMAGLIPGTIVAGTLLSVLSASGLGVMFSVLVLGAVAMSVSGVTLARSRPTLVGAGVLSGFMGTVAGIGGPPVALLYQHSPGSQLRATLPRYFFAGGVLSALMLATVGHLGVDELAMSLALLPGLVLGFSCSRSVASRLDRQTVRPVVLGLCALAATAVLVRDLL